MDWELLLNFKWPHEGFSVGYEIIRPTDSDNYTTIYIHLGFMSVIVNYG